jgi:DNA-binding NarL/FixJ family response regulator
MDRQIRGSSEAAVLLAHGEAGGAVLTRREETIAGAMEAGTDGFLAKDASSRQVAEAIRTLATAAAASWPRPSRRPRPATLRRSPPKE